MRRSFLPLAALVVAGCSATTGGHPLDMSAAQHAVAAEEHEKRAARAAAQYDPKARRPAKYCGYLPAEAESLDSPCWTSEVNPTAEHLREAADQRRRAAEHRAAMQALREAEERACAGLAEEDRDASPFGHREDIVAVEELRETTATNKSAGTEPGGVAITVRAVPGLTREYLQHLVTCHIARNASMGFAMPEMDFCPLAIKGVTAAVSGVEKGFRIEMRASSGDALAQLVRRSLLLAPQR